MYQPSEKELMFLLRLKEMNFIERIESIGSIAPGDDAVELMEWRFLRDDLLPFIQDAKMLPLDALREKYPANRVNPIESSHIEQPNSEYRYTVGRVTVSPSARDILIEQLGLREDDFEEEFPNDQRGSWYDCADGPDVGR